MRRRIFLIAVAALMLIGNTTFIYGQNDFIVCEDFNSPVKNKTAWKTSENVGQMRVPENRAYDLSLMLSTVTKQDAFASVTWKTEIKTGMIDFNFRSEGLQLLKEISVCDKNANELTLLSFRGGKLSVLTDNGMENINDYTKGQWFHIAIGFDLSENIIRIYKDQVLVSEKSAAFGDLQSVSGVTFKQIGQSGASDIAFIDDLRIYESVQIKEGVNVKKSKYFSTVSVQKPLEGLSADVTDSYDSIPVMWYEDFNAYTENSLIFDGWTTVPNNGTISAFKLDERHGYSLKLSTNSKDGNPILAKNMYSLSQTLKNENMRLRADTLGDFVIEFDSLFSDTEHMRLFAIKDDNNETNHTIFRTTVNGGWAFMSNPDVYKGSYEANKWYNIQVVFHSDGSKYTRYDLYFNNEKIADNFEIQGEPFTEIIHLRLSAIGKDDATGDWYLDNFKLYKGNKPERNLKAALYSEQIVNTEGNKKITPFDEKDKIEKLLQNTIVLGTNSNYALKDGKKVALDAGNPDVKMFVENSRAYVPVRFLTEQLGAEVKWDASLKSVELLFGDKKIILREGETSFTVNGIVNLLDAAPLFRDGRIFVPLRAITRALEKNIKWFDNGLAVVGDNHQSFLYFDTKIKHCTLLECAYSMIYHPQPSAEMILSNFYANKSQNSKGHPRIAIGQNAFENVKNVINSNSYMQKLYKREENNADSLLSTPVSEYTLSGGSATLLAVARTSKARVESLTVAYKITENEKYKERLWEELNALCSFADWNPGNGLSIAEMTYAVTIGYDWMYDEWTYEQRKLLEEAIYQKSLMVIYEAYTTEKAEYGWVYNTNNWNSVTNGCFGMAAIALMDVYPEVCSFIVENAFIGLSYFLPSYDNGGGFPEGPGYWVYATKYLTCFMASCENGMGTDYGLYNVPGISDTSYFLPYMTGSKALFNFHDSTEQMDEAPELLYYARRSNNPQLQSIRMYQINSGLSASNFYDLAWYNLEFDTAPKVALPLDRLFNNVVSASFRSAWNDPGCVYAGIHAGFVDVGHTQLDIGDFVIDALGERWACNLGMENYEYEGYFQNARFTYYRARAEGQNTVVINPSEGPDQDAKTAVGKVERYESKEQGGFIIIDTTSAYPDAEKAKRGLMLTDNRRTVVVRDEITLKDESEVYWFMHTRADISISDDGKLATLSQNGKVLYAHLLSDQDLKYYVMDAQPLETSPQVAQSKNPGVRKLVIHGKYLKKFNVSVVFSSEKTLLKQKADQLETWDIPDGENTLAHARMLYADGMALSDFSPYKANYTIMLENEDVPPKITAESSFEIAIKQAQSIYDIAVVTVYDTNDASNTIQYNISFQKTLTLGRPENMVKLEVANVTSSDSPQADLGYTPDKTIDGDLNTRWSAEANNYLVYDLGTEHDIAGVGVAWFNGTMRYSYYKVEISQDGINWQLVFNGQSTGFSNGIETAQFGPLKGQYVKLTGFGNSRGVWVSPTEVEIYTKNN